MYRYTNGTFIKNFLALAKRHHVNKDILMKLMMAPNGKKANPLSLAKSELTAKYMKQYLPWDHQTRNNDYEDGAIKRKEDH